MLPSYISVSILSRMKVLRAKLFRNGGSQAVRLPHEFRFRDGQSEVSVRREGGRVILEPADEWPDTFRACLGGWPEAILRPGQPKVRKARDPFR
jgi:antitoxin VapB